MSYFFQDLRFCGDTLFDTGCGYRLRRAASAMHASLQKRAALDEETRVRCAHECAEDNLRFARSLDSKNEALAKRILDVWALRARGECSVPSTIGEERATHPFLRHPDAGFCEALASAIDVEDSSDAEVLAATRRLKDRKDDKKASDDALPLWATKHQGTLLSFYCVPDGQLYRSATLAPKRPDHARPPLSAAPTGRDPRAKPSLDGPADPRPRHAGGGADGDHGRVLPPARVGGTHHLRGHRH